MGKKGFKSMVMIFFIFFSPDFRNPWYQHLDLSSLDALNENEFVCKDLKMWVWILNINLCLDRQLTRENQVCKDVGVLNINVWSESLSLEAVRKASNQNWRGGEIQLIKFISLSFKLKDFSHFEISKGKVTIIALRDRLIDLIFFGLEVGVKKQKKKKKLSQGNLWWRRMRKYCMDQEVTRVWFLVRFPPPLKNSSLWSHGLDIGYRTVQA